PSPTLSPKGERNMKGVGRPPVCVACLRRLLMDAFDDTSLALMKFGVGQPVPRKEDPTLLRGEGRYTDDVNLAGQVYAVMVRSKIAHGVLKGIDTKAASSMLGVLAILTHADLEAAGFGPLKCPMNIPQRD